MTQEFDPLDIVQAVRSICQHADTCPVESVVEAVTAQAQKQLEMVTELRQTFVRLLQVQEEERASIARELHENVAQLLSAAKMAVAPKQVIVHRILDQAIAAVWRVGTDLRPTLIDLVGVGAALEHLVRKTTEETGLECSISVTCDEADASADRRIALYRICQEALVNVTRHAQATKVAVRLSKEGRDLRLIITDDGKGFDPGEIPRGTFGLLGIRERLRVFGGVLEIQRVKPTGTRLVISLPEKNGSAEAAR